MTPEEKREKHAIDMREWRKNNPKAAKAIEDRRREAVKADPERLKNQREYQRNAQAAWRRANPEKRRGIARRSELIRRFGITPERYDEMVAEQEGLCAICKKPPRPTRRLSIDHDHACCPGHRSCGRCIRRLLCDSCNGGLGLFGDNIETLESALDYLRQHASVLL